jgi:hypothetical protein
MPPRLVAYRYVPPGVEMVIDNPDVEMGKVWNLWWNVKLSDDPEKWDSEIHLLNEMQAQLGELTAHQRLIRAQMAEFCRLHAIISEGIGILCEQIGTDVFSKPLKLGCGGRGLLDSLGYHDPQSVKEQEKEMLAQYALALRKWLARGCAQAPVESKVFGFLGQPTEAKENDVERLLQVIDGGGFSVAHLQKLAATLCEETQGQTILETRGRPLNCFHCEGCPDDSSAPRCPCCHAMILDAGLLCAGTRDEERSVLGEFSRFVQENVLACALALNSWLDGAPPKPLTSLTPARYVPEARALRFAARIHSLLGERNETKEWLAACLLKAITDNQRWHKTTELIDGFPDATSWFRRRG